MNSDKKRFKGITFDLWQTLIFEDEDGGVSSMRSSKRCENVARALSKLGFDVRQEKVALALGGTVDALLKIWDENRDITHRDQLQHLIRFALGSQFRLKKEWIPELSSAYISPLYEVPPYLNPHAMKMLRWLHGQNMRVGLICNTGITPGFALRRFLSKIGIIGFFDSMIFSDEAGIRKPDSKIFRLAAKELKNEPWETIHVGDNLKTDVWGAKNAGFKAIHLASEEGRDKQTENDPASLMSRSRNLGKIGKRKLAADATVCSLEMVIEVIEKLQDPTKRGP